MRWVAGNLGTTVSNQAMGVTFSATFKRGSEEFELTLVKGSTSKWSKQEHDNHLEAASQAVRDERARRRMIGLLNDPYLGRSYLTAAHVIERRTGKKVTERAIQTWVAEPTRRSSRRCPNWALKAIQEHIDEKKQKGAKPPPPMPMEPRLLEVLDKRIVGQADHAIDDDERGRAAWKAASFQEWPERIWKMQKDEMEWRMGHNHLIHAIIKALKTGKDLEEVRMILIDAIDEESSLGMYRTSTRSDMEAGRGEFGPPEQDI
jgi:hypothetical protein